MDERQRILNLKCLKQITGNNQWETKTICLWKWDFSQWEIMIYFLLSTHFMLFQEQTIK